MWRSALVVSCLLLISGCSTAGTAAYEPPPMTDQQVEAQAALDQEKNRQQYLEPYDLDAPNVSRIRFIDGNEWSRVMADCLTAAGFLTASTGEGLNSTPPKGQESAWALAAYTCSAQYPIDPHQTRPLTDEQIGHIYDYWRDDAVPCLEQAGAVGLPDPPSRQKFIDDYGSADDAWPLYWDLANQPGERWEEFTRLCPQQPPDLFG
jgi:hypothetical protein